MEVIISTWTKLQFPEGRVQDENDIGEQPELRTAHGLGKGANENLPEAEKHRPFPPQVRTPELGAVLSQKRWCLFMSCQQTELGFQLQAALPRGWRRGHHGALACEGMGSLPHGHRVPVPTSQRPNVPAKAASAHADNRPQERFASVTRHRCLCRGELSH